MAEDLCRQAAEKEPIGTDLCSDEMQVAEGGVDPMNTLLITAAL